MDPELWELFEGGSPEDEVSVIIRVEKGIEPPPSIRIVSRFGDVFTARILRREIVATRQHPGVISLKSSSLVTMPVKLETESEGDAEDEDAQDDVEDDDDADDGGEALDGLSRVTETGKGVVVGVCDWGIDFTHPNFRNADGTTRFECIWDQRGADSPFAPKPYTQGRLLTREAINKALADPDPFAALDYHPASADPTGTGAHGTHVCDIVAGNRREQGSRVGLASESDLVFVHLAPTKVGELGSLGDSISLLEGLDFIRRQAAGRPCVLHLSAGKTLGPKRGSTLLERAVDTMLQEPGIVLVQSVGNYATAAMHSHARIGPAQRHEFVWITPENDRTSNELELWYSGEDVFEVALFAPDGREFSVRLGDRQRLTDDDVVWGNFYHRLHEPNSGLNHVVIFLYTAAPSGRWRVALRGLDIVDGRVHAWIERDASGRYQSRFAPGHASSRFTTNTICNCFRAIAVGAYDATKPTRPPTLFSSRGPTADGRQKPELAAPGYRIRAARSTPRDGWRGERRLCVKSGTSMAAPWVSGTAALMFSAAGRPLNIHEIRRLLIGTSDPHAGPSGRSSTQLGYGYLNIAAAVDAARQLGRSAPQPPAVSSRQTIGPPREDEAAAWAPEEFTEARVDDDTAWAQTWVEDAAVGEVFDAPAVGAEAAAEPAGELEAELLAVAESAAPTGGCGCGRGRGTERAPHETAVMEMIGADASDEAGIDEIEDAEDETAPFDWADIREALEGT